MARSCATPMLVPAPTCCCGGCAHTLRPVGQSTWRTAAHRRRRVDALDPRAPAAQLPIELCSSISSMYVDGGALRGSHSHRPQRRDAIEMRSHLICWRRTVRLWQPWPHQPLPAYQRAVDVVQQVPTSGDGNRRFQLNRRKKVGDEFRGGSKNML
ncbi:hypothetical protein BS78_10G177400 [Paspalum vaginatum]|nr:hypothetical protein BS78_10G177400 [Paspalum vaginatum]